MSSAENKRILIVEDNPIFLKMVRARLENKGYSVTSAEDGLTGYTKALREHPDLIILDLMLPKMDGHKVCRLLKFNKKFHNTPVIILTSRDLEEDADLAKKNGADAFVVKTTKGEILMDVVSKLLLKQGSAIDE
ncbi:response regulator [bacterium]|nr:response regulator [bacterium]